MRGGVSQPSLRAIGPYRLLTRLGAGGMGEVFLGVDPEGRPAAVKTIRPDLVADGTADPGPGADPDRDFRGRFRREIAAAQAVEGRYTARLLGGDAEADTPWMATEYIPGPALDRTVYRSGPLPPETVRALGLDLVRALRSIHHARVLHRDLKPGNVLLADGGPKVIDFGIARAFGAGTMTVAGAVVGSPGFMSPEHVRGSRHIVAASDIFCLATLLCYAATGEGLFGDGDGPMALVLFRIAEAEADLSRVPGWLRELLTDCLHPDPTARPDTAELERRFAAGTPAGTVARPPWPAPVQALITEREGELRRTLERAAAEPAFGPEPPSGASAVHGAPTEAGAVRPPPRPGGDGVPRRRRVLTGAAVLAATVLAVLGIRALAPGADDGAGARTGANGAAADTTSVSVDAYGGPDRNRIFSSSGARRPEGWRSWAARLADTPVACALDSRVLVCRLADGTLQVLDAASGARRWRTDREHPGERPAHDARGDGTHPVIVGGLVVSAEAGRLRARDVRDGSVRWERRIAGRGGDRGRILAADGRVFLTATGNDGGSEVLAYDVRGGHRLWSRALPARDGAAAGTPVGVQAFGTGLVYVLGPDRLTAYDAGTGKREAVSETAAERCRGARLSGGEVLCPGGHEGVAALDARTLERVDHPDDPVYPGVPPARGSVGALGSRGALTTEGDAVLLRRMDGTTLRVGPVARTPGGQRAAVSAGVFIGNTAVYADNAALYTLPWEGTAQRTPVKGAPGIRSAPATGNAGKAVRAPELLSAGGTVVLVYYDGTVRSLDLP